MFTHRLSRRFTLRYCFARFTDGARNRELTGTSPTSWRKDRLSKLEQKFTGRQDSDFRIESEEELQSHWKEMESRVTRRRPLSATNNSRKIGRQNIRRTDEDEWLDSGLYENTKPTRNT